MAISCSKEAFSFVILASDSSLTDDSDFSAMVASFTLPMYAYRAAPPATTAPISKVIPPDAIPVAKAHASVAAVAKPISPVSTATPTR